ncbi:MAG: NAD(+)/NADH kinase [bacterium]
MTYRRHQYQRFRPPNRSTLYLVVNKAASDYLPKKIDSLIAELKKENREFHLIDTDSPAGASTLIRQAVNRHPEGIIACGGDGTVNLVAQHLARRSPILGIFPLGKFNNIYRSLYGEPDTGQAIKHFLSGRARRIDHALVDGNLVLGSLAIGLIPELNEIIGKRRIPRFGISWSRYASQAAARVQQTPISIKMDAFQFDIAPRLLNINLLPYTLGLPMTGASLDDDGKAEVIFDVGDGKAILSGYIRMIFKKKYIYSDEIRIYRGHKILLTPLRGKNLYLDGDIIPIKSESLSVEVFEKKIRLFDLEARPAKESAVDE